MSKLNTRPKAGALVIPYQVDETRKPIDFKAIDSDHIDRCAEENRCGICGGKIRSGPVALIGPDDGRNCFADPWMHIDCADLAMQQCPFLAGRKSWRDADGRESPFIATYAHNMVLYTATNWRLHRDRFGHWHFEAVGGLTKLTGQVASGDRITSRSAVSSVGQPVPSAEEVS